MAVSNWIEEVYPKVQPGMAPGAAVTEGAVVAEPINPSQSAYELDVIPEDVAEEVPVPVLQPGRPAVDVSAQDGYQSGDLPLKQWLQITVPPAKKGRRSIWSVATTTPIVKPFSVHGNMDFGPETVFVPGAGVTFGMLNGQLRVVAPSAYAGMKMDVTVCSSKPPAPAPTQT
ncbi:MAG: hypothetical protein ACR2RB_16005 [Gammaproteobacteria bacterium]